MFHGSIRKSGALVLSREVTFPSSEPAASKFPSPHFPAGGQV